MQSAYKRNIELLSCDHCYRGKAISVTYSEYACVAALVIQYTMRMLRVILSCVASPTVPYWFTLSLNGTIFFETLLNIKCVFGFL